MKKLIIFSMMVLSFIVSSITIFASDLIIPEADVNIRTMNYSYSTNIQDEILYLSTILPTVFNGKDQVVFAQYTQGNLGNYIDSVFGGAKVRYRNSTGGSILKSEKLTLGTYHTLDTSYAYFEVQLVFALVESLSQERAYIEGSILPSTNTYAISVSEGIAININNVLDLYNNAFSAGELSGYQGGYDQGYTTGYYDGTLNTQEGLAVLPIAFVGGLNSILSLNFGGVTLGALIMIPISIGLFLWFIKISRK
jgi:hypothetical protein